MSSVDPAPSGTTPESPAPSTSEDPSGTSTRPARAAASTPLPTCRVEIEIPTRRKAIPKGLRINGFSIPNVVSVVASYSPMQPRRVTIVLMPTDVIEIDPESEQRGSTSDTVEAPERGRTEEADGG